MIASFMEEIQKNLQIKTSEKKKTNESSAKYLDKKINNEKKINGISIYQRQATTSKKENVI